MKIKQGAARIQHRSGFKGWGLAILFLLSINFAACAPTLYSLNMMYEPTHAAKAADSVKNKAVVTLATFEDLRKISDKMMIGQVVKVDGGKIPVFPKYVRPPEAVTSAVRDYLVKAGFTISGDKPAWDLKAETLRKEWGNILIGGSIDELEVSCEDLMPTKKFRARIKLTLYFADAKKKWIFYKTSAQSSSSLDHVLFSEDRLEHQLNGVFSDAIEKIFEGGEAERMIMKAVQDSK